MKPRLSIINGSRASETFDLVPDQEVIIGRDQSADLCLPEKKVSRRHARVIWSSAEKTVSIEDLNSLNGSFLNTEPLRSRTTLQEGDQIRIGSFILRVHLRMDSPSLNPPHISGVVEISTASQKNADFFDDLEEANQSGDHNPLPPADPEVDSVFQRFVELETEDHEDMGTGGRIIAGKLAELSLPDVLQMLAATRKSGVLVVSKSKLAHLPASGDSNNALVFLEDGLLVNADFDGQCGDHAFYRILQLHEGFFALFPKTDDFPEPHLHWPIEQALLEGLRRLDEQVSEASIDLNTQLEAEPGESLSSLQPDELKVFQLAWKHQYVEKVIQLSGIDHADCLQILKKLVKAGLLKKIA